MVSPKSVSRRGVLALAVFAAFAVLGCGRRLELLELRRAAPLADDPARKTSAPFVTKAGGVVETMWFASRPALSAEWRCRVEAEEQWDGRWRLWLAGETPTERRGGHPSGRIDALNDAFSSDPRAAWILWSPRSHKLLAVVLDPSELLKSHWRLPMGLAPVEEGQLEKVAEELGLRVIRCAKQAPAREHTLARWEAILLHSDARPLVKRTTQHEVEQALKSDQWAGDRTVLRTLLALYHARQGEIAEAQKYAEDLEREDLISPGALVAVYAVAGAMERYHYPGRKAAHQRCLERLTRAWGRLRVNTWPHEARRALALAMATEAFRAGRLDLARRQMTIVLEKISPRRRAAILAHTRRRLEPSPDTLREFSKVFPNAPPPYDKTPDGKIIWALEEELLIPQLDLKWLNQIRGQLTGEG